jgi:CRISPR/Cas system-associated protein Csm6
MLTSIISDLQDIAVRLRRYHTKACNFGLSSRNEIHYEDLKGRAQDLTDKLGMKIYIQTDPRGAALFLGDETMNKENYNHFLCLEK